MLFFIGGIWDGIIDVAGYENFKDNISILYNLRINLSCEKCAYNLRDYSLCHCYNLKPIIFKESTQL